MATSETGLPNSWARGSLWGMTKRVQVVTFIGAGGKTTCLRSLTQEIVSAGQRVIATTTTKVFPEEQMNSWRNPNPPPFEQEGACFWYVNVIEESGKWIGPPLKAVDKAIGRARADLNVGIQELLLNVSASTNVNTSKSMRGQRTVPELPELHDLYWVIEGDGARGLKLKCWQPHEPQIPQRSDCVVLVLDGGLWGRVLQAEQVHRPAGCPDLIGHVWNAEKAWRYFLRSPLFTPQYGQMSWVILLNIHGGNSDNEDLVEPLEPLNELKHRWAEIEQEVNALEYRPKHLCIAAGDAKEGKLLWFDLW
ncbi:MAG: putative selenium-dependent hydroxylase accessory protein YqeC [Desulfosporosinus sp.]|nr:putative selenium-dependent hydroxylase accessory protein YqeC [Desulfosporosinus sp.]